MRVSIAKSSKKAKASLVDIEVDEISYVDKAANKRVWLIVKGANGNGDPTEAPHPETPPVESQPPAETPPTPVPPVEVEKKGAKMAKERLARFKGAIDALNALAAELEPALVEAAEAAEALESAETTQKRATGPTDGERAALAKVADLEAKLAEVEAKLATTTATLATRDAELATTKAVVSKQAAKLAAAMIDGVARSGDSEGAPVGGAEPPHRWPPDLNADREARRKRERQGAAA